jgi:dipeptidyl aminopeptidase/acylaminoacyl peptidase
MRYAAQPVDFVYFPQGSHSLAKPLEKLISQQGTLQWFNFWQSDSDRLQSCLST